jgi:hypothetical protein
MSLTIIYNKKYVVSTTARSVKDIWCASMCLVIGETILFLDNINVEHNYQLHNAKQFHWDVGAFYFVWDNAPFDLLNSSVNIFMHKVFLLRSGCHQRNGTCVPREIWNN